MCYFVIVGPYILQTAFPERRPPVKAVFNADSGKLVGCKSAIPTCGQEGREKIFAALFSLIEKLGTQGVTVIGISSAGNIDPSRGVCVYATDNLRGWTGTDIKGEVEAKFHIPCRVDNDAVCALKGELTFYPNGLSSA